METEDGITPEVVEKDDAAEMIESVGEVPERELDALAKHESRESSTLQKFKPRIASEAGQILRDWQRDCPYLDSWGKEPSNKRYSRLLLLCQESIWIPGLSQWLSCLGADTWGTCVDEATWQGSSPELKAIDWALATQSNS
ncbi:unnamed protein product [Gulo gulo]|uniref:Uncharacterized protein n=1 Tax=Gulo gulo TaxID=48420 RepID=A0A9X9PVE9_GULGU|nr:unnamed protein product [Gulo gulo]